MTCKRCQHHTCKRFGYFGKRRVQRWRCTSCKATFCEPHERLTRDTLLSQPDTAERAIHCLLEGCSIRSTERLTGLNRNTIMRLLIAVGERCERLLDERLKNLPCRYVQCDEIWCFVGKKQRRIRKGDSPEFGDQWIFVAEDADTKLIASYFVGKRTMGSTMSFISDLHKRLAAQIQLTTDGFHFYRNAVADTFGLDIDFAAFWSATRYLRQDPVIKLYCR